MLEPKTNERIRELTELIASEKDHDKLTELITELNQLLDGTAKAPYNPSEG